MARNEKIKRKRNKFYLKKGDVVKTYYVDLYGRLALTSYSNGGMTKAEAIEEIKKDIQERQLEFRHFKNGVYYFLTYLDDDPFHRQEISYNTHELTVLYRFSLNKNVYLRWYIDAIVNSIKPKNCK